MLTHSDPVSIALCLTHGSAIFDF